MILEQDYQTAETLVSNLCGTLQELLNTLLRAEDLTLDDEQVIAKSILRVSDVMIAELQKLQKVLSNVRTRH